MGLAGGIRLDLVTVTPSVWTDRGRESRDYREINVRLVELETADVIFVTCVISVIISMNSSLFGGLSVVKSCVCRESDASKAGC